MDDDQTIRNEERARWWQNPAIVGLLVAIIAAVPQITGGISAYVQSEKNLQLEAQKQRNQLELEKSKNLFDLRQRYLDKVLNNSERQRVIEFMVAIEEDPKLKRWAQQQLEQTSHSIKADLYVETISVVATIANDPSQIINKTKVHDRFWKLYTRDLLPVESQEVEGLMVQIGREIESIEASPKTPPDTLKRLSYELARTMKTEIKQDDERRRADRATP